MAETAPDIESGRLSAAELEANFADVEPPLDPRQALIESSRCYFCYDAPCIEHCPTGIDIPGFIRKIADYAPSYQIQRRLERVFNKYIKNYGNI